MTDLTHAELGKFISAKVAMEQVEHDMKLGLGTGSTANWLIRLLAHAKRHDGLRFQACATSSQSTQLAQKLGIDIKPLDDLGQLDLAIDGADEFDPALNLIKGAGGALLQEKIVESATNRLIIITDASKSVAKLGAFALPVELVQFGWQTTKRQIEQRLATLGYHNVSISRRGGETPYITDEGHYILDLELSTIDDIQALSDGLLAIAGVVETGLFIDMCDLVVMGDGDGFVHTKAKNQQWDKQPFDPSQYADLIAEITDTGK